MMGVLPWPATACALLTIFVADGTMASVAPAQPAADSGALLSVSTPTPAAAMEPIHILDARAPQPSTVSLAGYSAVGCFQHGSNHILTITSLNDSGMTPQLCRNICSVESASIFGVEFGMKCYCGNEIEPFAVRAPDDECTATCFGASNYVCGARSRINVYAHTDIHVSGDTSATSTGDSNPLPTSTPGSSADLGSNSNDGDTAGNRGDSDPDSGPGPSASAGASGGQSEDEVSNTSAPGGASLSVGVVVGIAIGAGVLSGSISAVVVFLLCRRRHRFRDEAAPTTVGVSLPEPAYAPQMTGGFLNQPQSSTVLHSHQGHTHELDGNLATTHEMPGGRRPDDVGDGDGIGNYEVNLPLKS